MRTIAVVSVITLCLGSAQVAVAQEGVVLQHQFELGQELEYRVAGTVTGNLEVEGEQPQGMPAGDMTWTFETGTMATVEALGADFGEMAVRLRGFEANANVQGFDIRIEVNETGGGVWVGGQQMVDLSEITRQTGGFNPFEALFNFPFLVRLHPSGKVVGAPQLDFLKIVMPQLKLDELMEISTGYLPQQPVQVGDTWEQVIALPFSVPDLNGEPQTEFSYDYTLSNLQEEAGGQVALIDFTGHFELGDMRDFKPDIPLTPFGMPMPGPFGGPQPAAEPGQQEEQGEAGGAAEEQQPKGGLRSLEADVQGQMSFDVARGLILDVTADFTMNMHLTQVVPQPPAPEQGPGAEVGGEPTEPPPLRTVEVYLRDFQGTVEGELLTAGP